MADRKGLLQPIDVEGLLAAREMGLLSGSVPTGEMKAYHPSLRDRLGNTIYDLAVRLGLEQQANTMRNEAQFAADFVPGLGDAGDRQFGT